MYHSGRLVNYYEDVVMVSRGLGHEIYGDLTPFGFWNLRGLQLAL